MITATMNARYWHYLARPVARATPVVIAVIVFVALFIGWLNADEEHLTPKSGLGYWLGVAGSLMMLALLIYSYRKRTRAKRKFGTIPTWFRIHMMLGVLGPVLIMFHSNFSLGALNSNVALFAMLTVATSGVIGRYIYGKIHMGLYGRKAAAREIFEDVSALREELGDERRDIVRVFDELDAFGRQFIEQRSSNAAQSLWLGGTMAFRSWLLRSRVRRELRQLVDAEGEEKGWSHDQRRRRAAEVDEAVTIYLNALLKAIELRFFERLFSLWHVLHLPLFVLMVMAALVHVWAAHRY